MMNQLCESVFRASILLSICRTVPITHLDAQRVVRVCYCLEICCVTNMYFDRIVLRIQLIRANQSTSDHRHDRRQSEHHHTNRRKNQNRWKNQHHHLRHENDHGPCRRRNCNKNDHRRDPQEIRQSINRQLRVAHRYNLQDEILPQINRQQYISHCR